MPARRAAPPLTAPQLGGFTLTSAVLYLTISMHTQNRAIQAALLRQQRHVLAGFVEPKQPEPEPANRIVDAGLAEMAKDRWNRELENVVHKVYNTDWRRVRENVEDRLGALVENVRK